MITRPGAALAIVAAAVVWSAAPVRAQDASAAAQIEFDRGQKLMQSGDFVGACVAFDKSQRIDPQIGTRYNLGLCNEKQGKLASAWNAFREVAQRDRNAARKQDAARRAAALKPRLTKLLINAAASPDGFVVKLNGTDATTLLGIEAPVDPGQYTVVASAPTFKSWSATVSATGEGLTVTVSIPPLEKAAVATTTTTTGPTGPDHAEPGKEGTALPPGPAHVETHAARPGHGRKVLGLAIGGGGVALVAGGVVAGVMASGKWSEAKDVCGGSLTCPTAADTARANELGDAARTRANIATGLIGAGIVAVGVGATLWLTAPKESRNGVAIVPAAGPHGVSVTMEGRF